MSLKERFIRAISAISFCLSYDGYRGDLEALAKWTLSGDAAEPTIDDQCLNIALISGGATRIKGYVFESARLPEIRGASSLLDRINIEDTPRLWEELGAEGSGCRDCIIYANGGEVLAFAPISKASWLADEIERLYAHETLVAQSVAVWRAFELRQIRGGLTAGEQVDDTLVRRLLGYNPTNNKTFGSLVAPLALAKFRRREANEEDGRNLRRIAHIETVPFARRCSSCERRAAVADASIVIGEERPLCEPCARKRVFGQLTKRESANLGWWDRERFAWEPEPNGRKARTWATHFEDWLAREEQSEIRRLYVLDESGRSLSDPVKLESANDLGEIAQASKPSGFIGVVYADANNMGQILEHLETPLEYATFAKRVYETMLETVFGALARNLHAFPVERERGGARIHPFEILNIGGDDVLLIVPAHVALKIACDIAATVEGKLLDAHLFEHNEDGKSISYDWRNVQRCRGESPAKQSRVNISAGVLIADAHTPIFYLEGLANQLLKSAKHRSKLLNKRGYYGGEIDFLTLKSVTAISGTIEEFRSDTLTIDNRHLYARPYTVAETLALIESIRILKSANFPRSQLYRLAESLHSGEMQSVLDYVYFLTRDVKADEARRKVEALWTPDDGQVLPHPWREQLSLRKKSDLQGKMQERNLETIWFDLVELYGFVSEED